MRFLKYQTTKRLIRHLILSGFIASQFFFTISSNHAADIAVLYALEEDLKTLRGDSPFSTSTINGTKIQTFRVAKHRVFATQMGVGNAETAINASNLLARNRCDLVVAVGPAGSLGDTMAMGEMIQIERVVGYQRGTWTRTGWELSPSATTLFPTDSIDLNIPEVGKKNGLASGDAFIASLAARERIATESGCGLVDMNSYGLLQACEKAGVPLAIFKVVSDQAGDEAGDQFRDFVSSYDGRLGRAVRRAIEKMPISNDSPAAYESIRELLE